jgi:uncharacterized C2H2 Zn-finger protein
MTMSKKYKRQCKCCGVEFETNRSDKFYVNRSHQVKNNNRTQAKYKEKLKKITGSMYSTYRIFDKLIGSRESLRTSKDYLRGAGAKLGYFTHHDKINNKTVPILIDIALIDEDNYVTLKRI